MKMRYLKYMAICSLMMAGCGKEPQAHEGREGLAPLHFSLSGPVSAEVESKAPVTGETDTPGAALADGSYHFGLFICSDNNTYAPLLTGYDNIEAMAKKTSIVSSWTWTYSWLDNTGESILSIRKGMEAYIYAYHPHAAGQKDHRAIEFTTNEEKDWMWAEPVYLDAEKTLYSPVNVNLAFSHAMTCIEVMVHDLYEGDIELTAVELTYTDAEVNDGTGVVTSSILYEGGTFNAENGEVTEGTPTRTVTVSPENVKVDMDGESVYFIMPEINPYEGGLELSFIFNGIKAPDPYKLMPADVDNAFKLGHKYRYSFAIDNTMNFSPVVETSNSVWTRDETDIKI